jgi:hypothetical protein
MKWWNKGKANTEPYKVSALTNPMKTPRKTVIFYMKNPTPQCAGGVLTFY